MSADASPLRPVHPDRPALPQSRAFVVRFSEEPGAPADLFKGRVEHVTSGDQAVFTSVEQLEAFCRRVLHRTSGAAPLGPGTGETVSR